MRVPLSTLFLLLLLLLALDLTPLTSRAATVVETGDEVTIEAVALTSEGLDHPALVDALALRLPEIELLAADDGCGARCVHVRVRALADPTAPIMIEARLDDGRAFSRSIRADSPESERGVATLLAHLLTSLVAGDPTVFEEIGSAPETTDENAGEEPPRQLRGGTLTSAPEPNPEPLPSCPQPGPQPAGADESLAPAPPMYELGPALGLVTVMGIGAPRSLAGRVGGGTLLDLELRSPSGLLVGASGRLLDARESGYRLTRLRFALALGYGLRRGLFELRALAAVSVEPWKVGGRADGARTTFGHPLLGGALILAPGVQAALSSGVRVHAGLRAAASASAPSTGVGTILATDSAGEPLFRLGGFELSVLAEIGARWGIQARSPRARRPTRASMPARQARRP